MLQLARSLCCPDVASALEQDGLEFADELDSLSHLTERQKYDTSLAANCGIMSRLLCFKGDPSPGPESH